MENNGKKTIFFNVKRDNPIGIVSFSHFIISLGAFYKSESIFKKETQHEFTWEIVSKNGKLSYSLTVPEELVFSVFDLLKLHFPGYEVIENELNTNEDESNTNILVMEFDVVDNDCIPLATYYEYDLDYREPKDLPGDCEHDRFSIFMDKLSDATSNNDLMVAYRVSFFPAKPSDIKKCNYFAENIKKDEESIKKLSNTMKVLSKIGRFTQKAFNKSTSYYYPSNEIYKFADKANHKSICNNGFYTNISLCITDNNPNSYNALSVLANNFTSIFQSKENNKLIANKVLFDEKNPATNYVCKKFINGKRILLGEKEISGIIHWPIFFDNKAIYKGAEEGKFSLVKELPNTPTLDKKFILENDVTLFGKVFSAKDSKDLYFGQKQSDRQNHTYIIGKTGTGKSALMYSMIMSDIIAGRGVFLIDPHGDLADKIVKNISHNEKLVYFNPSSNENALPLNIFETKNAISNDLLESTMMSIFKHMFDYWNHDLEYFLRNAVASLICMPNASISDITLLMTSEKFKNEMISYLKDDRLKSFWLNEYPKFNQGFYFSDDLRIKVLNKLTQFSTNATLRKIFDKNSQQIKIEEIINNNQIFIANLSSGKLGEEMSLILGKLLLAKIQLCAMSSAINDFNNRPRINLYIDEFGSLANDDLLDKILSEARKYNLGVTVANQYLGQLDSKIREALLSNVSNLIAFNTSSDDAWKIKDNLGSKLELKDMSELIDHEAIAKFYLNGESKNVKFSTIKETDFDNVIA